MNGENIVVSVIGIVMTVAIGCLTYYHVIESNNSKEIVNAAIARGLDPAVAACASQVSTSNRDVRSTCEKMAIIKGK